MNDQVTVHSNRAVKTRCQPLIVGLQLFFYVFGALGLLFALFTLLSPFIMVLSLL